jgi:hypothetical protein
MIPIKPKGNIWNGLLKLDSLKPICIDVADFAIEKNKLANIITPTTKRIGPTIFKTILFSS